MIAWIAADLFARAAHASSDCARRCLLRKCISAACSQNSFWVATMTVATVIAIIGIVGIVTVAVGNAEVVDKGQQLLLQLRRLARRHERHSQQRAAAAHQPATRDPESAAKDTRKRYRPPIPTPAASCESSASLFVSAPTPEPPESPESLHSLDFYRVSVCFVCLFVFFSK